MYAFLDAEYNTDRHSEEKSEEKKEFSESDHSLIEVALIITDNEFETVETYHSYVRPKGNQGKLYSQIVKLTGIKQEDVDKGISFKDTIANIHNIVIKYGIKKIYVYGSYDKYAFQWNNKQYGAIPYGNSTAKRLLDVSIQLRTMCQLKHEISLESLAYICETESKVTHFSMDDAETLKEVYAKINTTGADIKKCEEYNTYVFKRDTYNKLILEINKLIRNGMGKDEILDMVNNPPLTKPTVLLKWGLAKASTKSQGL